MTQIATDPHQESKNQEASVTPLKKPLLATAAIATLGALALPAYGKYIDICKAVGELGLNSGDDQRDRLGNRPWDPSLLEEAQEEYIAAAKIK